MVDPGISQPAVIVSPLVYNLDHLEPSPAINYPQLQAFCSDLSHFGHFGPDWVFFVKVANLFCMLSFFFGFPDYFGGR